MQIKWLVSIWNATLCWKGLNENIYWNRRQSRKRANLKTGVTRKPSTPNFSKNDHFLPPGPHTHTYISGGKKCSFFGKFGLLCFLVTPILRFTCLPYYRRNPLVQTWSQSANSLKHYFTRSKSHSIIFFFLIRSRRLGIRNNSTNTCFE